MRDAYVTFSQDQSVAATAASENELEFPAGNIGEGSPVFLHGQVMDAFEGAGDITVELQDSADGSAWVTRMNFGPLDEDRLYSGASFRLSLPTGLNKHLRLRYVKDGTLSTGSFYAGLAWT
ncbi:MAG: hypothetical protein LAT56_00320 [Wenzhouxiangella sp.]|nr:hypothetical protein [Wenzhouxiangella sp.]